MAFETMPQKIKKIFERKIKKSQPFDEINRLISKKNL